MLQSYRWLLILAMLVILGSADAVAQQDAPPSASVLRTRLGQLAPMQQDEVLWLARCIYSESDRAHEQRLVAWVVRNRAETGYRGQTYREVVLEPRQFSAFNEPSVRRNHILNLNAFSLSRTWRNALAIALEVYQAPGSQRPFSITTRHFYSPISMKGGRAPHWAQTATSLPSARLGVDPYRFRFFADIDEDAEMPVQTVSVAETRAPASGQTLSRLKKRRSRLLGRGFSGRVKRPVRPHLSGRTRQ